MQLAVVQNNPVFGDIETNLNATETLLQSAAADVWVLPELFASGYLFTSRDEVFDLAEEWETSPTRARMLRWARQLGAVVAGGWPERKGDVVYNSATIAAPDGSCTHYRKLHLFADEKKWFHPGDLSLPVVEFRGVRLGLMICFDWRFPEAARSLALQGADAILHPANLVHSHCPNAMITRSLENRVFTATADRWGEERRGGQALCFLGRSQIVDPLGRRLGRLPRNGDGIISVSIDPAQARDKHVTPTNHVFQDRRPDHYLV